MTHYGLGRREKAQDKRVEQAFQACVKLLKMMPALAAEVQIALILQPGWEYRSG